MIFSQSYFINNLPHASYKYRNWVRSPRNLIPRCKDLCCWLTKLLTRDCEEGALFRRAEGKCSLHSREVRAVCEQCGFFCCCRKEELALVQCSLRWREERGHSEGRWGWTRFMLVHHKGERDVLRCG